MATDLAQAVALRVAERLAPADLVAALEPTLVRLFVHEFNNRHSAVTGFAALLRRAVAEPGPRAAALVGRLDEAAEKTGRLARALAFLTAPHEAGEVAAADLLAPVEAIGAPHLLKTSGLTLTCEASGDAVFPTVGPLAAKLLMYAAACLSGRGAALTIRAAVVDGRPALAFAYSPGDPAPDPAALAAAAALLRAIPGGGETRSRDEGLPELLTFSPCVAMKSHA